MINCYRKDAGNKCSDACVTETPEKVNTCKRSPGVLQLLKWYKLYNDSVPA